MDSRYVRPLALDPFFMGEEAGEQCYKYKRLTKVIIYWDLEITKSKNFRANITKTSQNQNVEKEPSMWIHHLITTSSELHSFYFSYDNDLCYIIFCKVQS